MPTATSTAGAGRDKYAWPCAANSIWNMPIGSNAVYVSAGLQPANAWQGKITNDFEFINLSPSYPLKSLGAALVHVPPTMQHDGGWNGVAAFLGADGSTVYQGQPLQLSPGGNPSWQYNYPAVDIKGDCIAGAHGGSALSSFGGSLRPGELDAGAIHHSLKINAYAKRFLSCSNGGYRWPAPRADAYMSCTTYGGTVPQMRMGSLVALRPSENCAAYTDVRARTVCHALQDYGAYIVDDTFWDVHALDGDVDVEALPAQFHSDVMTMMLKLAVVDNNGPASIGGGGTPRVPLAPPFAN